jgi:uncharacterized membrane protein YkoI
MRRARHELRIRPEPDMNRSFMRRSSLDGYRSTVRWAAVILAVILCAAVGRADDDDHERALRAREKGEIVPLSRILTAVEAEFEGRFVEVELEKDDGRLVYEIELLTPQGNMLELSYDARTGAFIEAEGKGVEAARKRR